MKTNTASTIRSIIEKKGSVRPHDLIAELKLSAVAVHKQLKALVERGVIKKVGKPPRIYYSLPDVLIAAQQSFADTNEIISKTYLYVHPNGTLMYGMRGFMYWATEVNKSKDLGHIAQSYIETRLMADSFIGPHGWIDGTEKMMATFHDSELDVLMYKDFYSLPMFGKTILGQLVLYAKLSQDRALIADISHRVQGTILEMLREYSIDFVSFIPATIRREVQFMKLFEQNLSIPKPTVALRKIQVGDVVVAQKSLSKLNERVDNARATILLESSGTQLSGKRILLLDDAVGSGATLHEVAKKMKAQGASYVAGFAPVGSFKGFDVLREV